MENILIMSDRFFGVVEWLWRSGGWWGVGAAVSVILLVGFGIQRAPYR